MNEDECGGAVDGNGNRRLVVRSRGSRIFFGKKRMIFSYFSFLLSVSTERERIWERRGSFWPLEWRWKENPALQSNVETVPLLSGKEPHQEIFSWDPRIEERVLRFLYFFNKKKNHIIINLRGINMYINCKFRLLINLNQWLRLNQRNPNTFKMSTMSF